MSGKGIMSNISGSIDGYMDAVTGKEGENMIDDTVQVELPPFTIEDELLKIREFKVVLSNKYKDYHKKQLYDALIGVDAVIQSLEEVRSPTEITPDDGKI